MACEVAECFSKDLTVRARPSWNCLKNVLQGRQNVNKKVLMELIDLIIILLLVKMHGVIRVHMKPTNSHET
jgi:hypothetical protein